MIPGQLIEMFQLQDKMNRVINPDWINAGYDWSRAIFVESAELLDHIGWKWWKHQEMNLEQAQLEFVDIWHFVLSHVLAAHDGNVQAATLALLDGWKTGNSQAATTPAPAACGDHRLSCWAGLDGQVAPNVLYEVAQRLGLSDAKLFELYVGKNALNHFRQKHGYKDGTYIKMWGGLEDNAVLSVLLAENPGISYDPLMALLDEAYASGHLNG